MNMSIKFFEIKPGIGIGELKFGLTRAEVEKILGKPDEVEKMSHSSFHDEPTEAWHYDGLNLSLAFDEADDWRLVNISTTSDESEIQGKKLFGLTQLSLIRTLNSLGLDDLDIDSSEPGQQLLSSEELHINFWLEKGELAEIQFGPHLIDDDTVKWPD